MILLGPSSWCVDYICASGHLKKEAIENVLGREVAQPLQTMHFRVLLDSAEDLSSYP